MANITIPENTTIGPGTKPNTMEMPKPTKALTPPKIVLKKAYLNIFVIRFLAAIAGTTTRNPTSKVPTILMPMETTTEMRNRYRRLIIAMFTPFDAARSSEIIDSTSLRYNSLVNRMAVIEIVAAMAASVAVTFVMLPKRASRSSGSS